MTLTVKNVLKRDLWCCFIPQHGRTLKPGETVTLPGDPRGMDSTYAWPRPGYFLQKLLDEKQVEIVPDVPQPVAQTVPLKETPAEQQKPDVIPETTNTDVVGTVEEKTASVDETIDEVAPADPEPASDTAETDAKAVKAGKKKTAAKVQDTQRTLPVIEQSVVYSSLAEQFTVDWSDTAGILPTDTFSVQVEHPDGSKLTVAAHTDTMITYNTSAGYGDYVFTVVLTDKDKNTVEGLPVSRTVV